MNKAEKTGQSSPYYLAGAVSLLTFMVYLSSLQNGFVGYDDNTYVLNNPHIRTFDPDFFKWAVFDFYAANWHPLTWISHALDYAIWELDPMGHHLTNNILHAVNTFLVVLLVVRLMEVRRQSINDKISPNPSFPKRGPALTPPLEKGDGGEFSDKKILIAAGVTGLLFGLHPIHVESVAWVAERKDLLCALFYLLSIMMYMGYVCSGGPGGNITPPPPSLLKRGWRSRGRYIVALFFFTLALMSKPMAVSLPVVLLILDWYPFKRITSLKTFGSSVIEKLPFIALSISLSILTILAQKAGGAMELMKFVPLSTRVLVAAQALSAYLWQMLVPHNLMPFYEYPANVSFLTAEYFLPLALIIGITAASAGAARKEKLWLAVWLYYTGTLIPVLGIVQVGGQSMADRYTYLPGLGPFLITGITGAWLYEYLKASNKWGVLLKGRVMATVVITLALLSYSALRQIRIWKDGITLWNYVIEKEPLKVPRAYNNLGMALMDKGRIDEAVEKFQIALRLDPLNANATAFNNLGVAYKSKGLYDKAIEQFLAALSIRPDNPETHNNLGVVYRYKGMLGEAIEQHRMALALRPDFAEAHFNLGIIYLEIGDKAKARKEFEAGLKIRPGDQKARQVLNEIIPK